MEFCSIVDLASYVTKTVHLVILLSQNTCGPQLKKKKIFDELFAGDHTTYNDRISSRPPADPRVPAGLL